MASGTRGPWLLVRAAEAGDAQLVARLLGEGRDVNETDEAGCTALLCAAYIGRADVVRLLLARQDVEVNKTAQEVCTTALMIASQNGLLPAMKGLGRTSSGVNE
jgi:ankyrin repeat protein